jgi:hypothetical protein
MEINLNNLAIILDALCEADGIDVSPTRDEAHQSHTSSQMPSDVERRDHDIRE